MKTVFCYIVLSFVTYTSWSQQVPADSLYFGQTPPGSVPQLFAPGKVSQPGRKEAVITFSPDGASVFFYIQSGTPYTMYSRYQEDHWSFPDTIPFTLGRYTGEPIFAYGGDRLYMFATNAINHCGTADLSYSEKQDTGWSTPVSMGNPPNSEAYQYHPCLVGDTSVYFSSNAGDVCRCQYFNGSYQNRVILPRPVNHIGSATWGDPFVAADESYMILKSVRPEGYGQNDLYISYRKPDLSWTNPKNLGNVINTAGDEFSGDITPDGLYMTYGRNNDIYWVSTDFIDSLRFTNFLPYVKYAIPDQVDTTGHPFVIPIPDSTFFDDDGMNTLRYQAKLSNGDPLPAWLTFDTLSCTLSGTATIAQTLLIRITAVDTGNASTSAIMKLKIIDPSAINPVETDLNKVNVFPNPTTRLLNLTVDALGWQEVNAELYSIEGALMGKSTFHNQTTFDLSGRQQGIYYIILSNNNQRIVRKFLLAGDK